MPGQWMNNLLSAFLNNLLPIFLAAGAGIVLGKKTQIHPASLSKLVVYLFSPCLVFVLLTSSQLGNADILTMMGFTFLLIIVVAALMGGIGFLMRWDRSLIAAAVLASMATNAGNYGLSLNKFAFGDAALSYATVFMVVNALMTYTLGIMVASWGTQGSHKAGNPLLAPLRYPFVYAFILALVFNHFHLSLPLPVDRVVQLFSDAAIPLMLVLLGLQLANASWGRPSSVLIATNSIRLIASPLIALALSAIFILQGPARQAGILQAAMPTAVTATLLATEFELQPEFVTFSVAFSTLISIVTLTPLITFLS